MCKLKLQHMACSNWPLLSLSLSVCATSIPTPHLGLSDIAFHCPVNAGPASSIGLRTEDVRPSAAPFEALVFLRPVPSLWGLLGAELHPSPNSYAEVLALCDTPPSPASWCVALFGNRVFTKVIKLKWDH